MFDTRPIVWVGSARKAFSTFPTSVRDKFAEALTMVAEGFHPDIAKPLTGQLAVRHNKEAYRTIYAIKLSDAVYVLHAFQKKSKSGIKTPREDIALIQQRLKRIREGLA
ncbi:type II toxin-antitoxin system RelE/ParE family toxin [Marinivivus vitaminiproducens]|uniref:type II toxin-antitoxin system RelE/ParE family toxin n=1 Tax=Marinivivus vitaminiproducens TaxID=3035935 RepID=UPI0027AA05A8|nr:type II toxin-antitoxin system RelE/ParE family toxin [Geminicoccaceae bacterium SCSIO 64248]